MSFPVSPKVIKFLTPSPTIPLSKKFFFLVFFLIIFHPRVFISLSSVLKPVNNRPKSCISTHCHRWAVKTRQKRELTRYKTLDLPTSLPKLSPIFQQGPQNTCRRLTSSKLSSSRFRSSNVMIRQKGIIAVSSMPLTWLILSTENPNCFPPKCKEPASRYREKKPGTP